MLEVKAFIAEDTCSELRLQLDFADLDALTSQLCRSIKSVNDKERPIFVHFDSHELLIPWCLSLFIIKLEVLALKLNLIRNPANLLRWDSFAVLGVFK